MLICTIHCFFLLNFLEWAEGVLVKKSWYLHYSYNYLFTERTIQESSIKIDNDTFYFSRSSLSFKQGLQIYQNLKS